MMDDEEMDAARLDREIVFMNDEGWTCEACRCWSPGTYCPGCGREGIWLNSQDGRRALMIGPPRR